VLEERVRQPFDDDISAATLVDISRTPDGHPGEERQRAPRKMPSPLFIGIGLVLIIAVAAGPAVVSSSFRHQIEISIVRQQTSYTQLYFTHLAELPGKLRVDQKNVFDFTIVNNENRRREYTYTVTLGDSRSLAVVNAATVTVGTGASRTVPVAVVPGDRESRYLVSVALTDPGQSIHFYGDTS
jgi:hypothetical protein